MQLKFPWGGYEATNVWGNANVFPLFVCLSSLYTPLGLKSNELQLVPLVTCTSPEGYCLYVKMICKFSEQRNSFIWVKGMLQRGSPLISYRLKPFLRKLKTFVCLWEYTWYNTKTFFYLKNVLETYFITGISCVSWNWYPEDLNILHTFNFTPL